MQVFYFPYITVQFMESKGNLMDQGWFLCPIWRQQPPRIFMPFSRLDEYLFLVAPTRSYLSGIEKYLCITACTFHLSFTTAIALMLYSFLVHFGILIAVVPLLSKFLPPPPPYLSSYVIFYPSTFCVCGSLFVGLPPSQKCVSSTMIKTE